MVPAWCTSSRFHVLPMARRQRRCLGVVQAVDAFVAEVHRDAQPRLLHEPSLHTVDSFGMVAEGIEHLLHAARFAAHAVEHLVDVGDAVFPHLRLPPLCGEGVLQYTAVAVEGGQLAGFLVDVHLAEQVVHPLVHRLRGVFVDVLHAVLVEINPSLVVDGLVLCLLGQGHTKAQQCHQHCPFVLHAIFS